MATLKEGIEKGRFSLEDAHTLQELLSQPSVWYCSSSGVKNTYQQAKELLNQLSPEGREIWKNACASAEALLPKGAGKLYEQMRLARLYPNSKVGALALYALGWHFINVNPALGSAFFYAAWDSATALNDFQTQATIAFAAAGRAQKGGAEFATWRNRIQQLPDSVTFTLKGKTISKTTALKTLPPKLESSPEEKGKDRPPTIAQRLDQYQKSPQALLRNLEVESLLEAFPGFPLFYEDVFHTKEPIHMALLEEVPERCRFRPFPVSLLDLGEQWRGGEKILNSDMPLSELFESQKDLWKFVGEQKLDAVIAPDGVALKKERNLGGEFFDEASLRPFFEWSKKGVGDRNLGEAPEAVLGEGQTYFPLRLARWPQELPFEVGNLATSELPPAELIHSVLLKKNQFVIKRPFYGRVEVFRKNGALQVFHAFGMWDTEAMENIFAAFPQEKISVSADSLAKPAKQKFDSETLAEIHKFVGKYPERIGKLTVDEREQSVKTFGTK